MLKLTTEVKLSYADACTGDLNWGTAQHSRAHFLMFYCNFGFVLKSVRARMCYVTFRRPCEGK